MRGFVLQAVMQGGFVSRMRRRNEGVCVKDAEEEEGVRRLRRVCGGCAEGVRRRNLCQGCGEGVRRRSEGRSAKVFTDREKMGEEWISSQVGAGPPRLCQPGGYGRAASEGRALSF